MRKTLVAAALVAATIVTASSDLWAQGSSIYGSGLRVNLDTTGKKYFRFIVWNQFWARYQQFNEGSAVNGEPAKDHLDLLLRRSRFLIFGQLSSENLLMFHIGINNQTFNSGGAPGEPTGPGKKPQLFIHDAWYEQHITGKELYVGMGLSYWNGISRSTNASTLNFLAIDAPIFNWPTIDGSDEFARQFAIYAKGKIDKLDYRIALSQPFIPGAGLTGLSAAPKVASYSPRNNTKAVQGYLNWQFLDQESNLLPFMVGTYIGTKTVFNIGAGFYYHPDAMWYRNTAAPGDSAFANQALFAVDAFLDYPFGEGDNKMAVTAYGVFYSYNSGPNYVRNIGIASVAGLATGAAAVPANFNGAGSAYPTVGTGSIIYVQAGLLLPPNVPGVGKLQPYAAFTYTKFDRIKDAGAILEGGVNWFLEGHHAKLTLHYRNYPFYKQQVAGTGVTFTGPDGLPEVTLDSRRSELILQSMIYF